MDRAQPFALPQEITREIVTLHARVLLHMPVIQLLIVAGIGWIVLPSVSLKIFLLWSVLAVGTECLRALFAWWVLPQIDTFFPKRLHAIFMALDALAGGMVGLSAILFLSHLPLLSQVLIEIILFATAAAGVSVAVSSKYMLAAYSFLVLMEALIPWVFLHPEHAGAVVGLTLLYWMFLIGVAFESETLLYRSVGIRQERDRILATASHDLRQPLQSLSLYGAVLRRAPSTKTLEEIGNNIDHVVRELGGMLGDLLDLSNLASGAYPFKREFVSLDRCLEDVCAEFYSAASAKGLHLKRSLLPVWIVGDRQAVGRMARNLVDNAIKFTDLGEVHVSIILEKNGGVSLSVADTGKGIPESDRELVFEEFYQVGKLDMPRKSGTGLGLSIVRRLARWMEAEISLCSEIDVGSCFRVTFPGPVICSEQVQIDPTEVTPVKFLQEVRVSLVDGDAEGRKALSSLLTCWGATVRTAESLVRPETLFRESSHPELLVVALNSEEADDLLDRVTRLKEASGRCPVLLVVGAVSTSLLSRIRERGFPIVEKPASATLLQTALKSLLFPASRT